MHSKQNAIDQSGGAEFAAARDRLMLYIQGLDVDPVLGLELALESLRRAGAKESGANPASAMAEMFNLLKERDLNAWMPQFADRAMPPMKRQSMLSEAMDISIGKMLLRTMTGGFRTPRHKRPS